MTLTSGGAVIVVLAAALLYAQGPIDPTAPLVAPLTPMRPSAPRGASPVRPPRVPNLSGTWVLQSRQKGPDIPVRLVIDQLLARTNVRGKPIAPVFLRITITRLLDTGDVTETWPLGVVSERVSGVVSDGRHAVGAAPKTHYRVVWEKQTLVIERGSYTGFEPESGEWTERREQWSLDGARRLHLTITTRSSASVSRTVTLVYRRQ